MNFTPHDLHIIKDGKMLHTIPKQGSVARLVEQRDSIISILSVDGHNIPVVNPPTYTKVEGLHMSEGTVIVGSRVAEFLKRTGTSLHVYSPDTGPDGAVHNSHGQIIGTTRLIRWV